MKRIVKCAEQLQALAYGVIRVTGAGIFLILTLFGLLYSQYMAPYGYEVPVSCKDVPVSNLLCTGILFLVIFLLLYAQEHIPEKMKKAAEAGLLAAAALWVGCWGFWWINSIDRIPTGDQAFIYGGASYFLEKDFKFFGPGGYYEIYPHQLGLIALTELLFLAVGTYNYYAFEVVSVLMAVGIVLLGYLLLRELDAAFGTRILYLFLIAGCIPLVCYTSWVYGEIPSIFWGLAATCCVLRYHKRPKWYFLAGMVAALTMSVLVRKNSLVLLTALCLLTILYLLRKRDLRLAAAVILTIFCSWLSYQGVYKMYEIRSGYPHSEGLPVNSWIAMGLRDHNGISGWYDNMPKEVLYALDCDYDATREAMALEIKDRLSVFQKDIPYAVKFFARKVLSQWNAPLYQSIYFSAEYAGGDKAAEGSFLAGVYGFEEEFFRLFAAADRMQFLIYLGMLFYFLFAVKKEQHPLTYLLAVNIIGGFFFSILWEAKARYIFVYYVTMFPLAAIGYFQMAGVFRGLWKKYRTTCHFGKKTV